MNPLPVTRIVIRPNPDRALLTAYAVERDESAFAELVRRHAGMVRRAAAEIDPTAADDTAQATFVLLAGRAAELAARESAAGWLFETARRLALKARTAAARRARREAAVVPHTPADPLDELTFAEIRAVVGEELAKLPDRLRTPLVLHYWEGAALGAIADRLGCSASAVKRRLGAGRARLAARLVRRGFSGAAVLAVLTGLRATAQRAAPAGLVSILTGDRSGTLSPGAAALVRGATGAGYGSKLLIATAVLAAVIGLACGLEPTAGTAPPIPASAIPLASGAEPTAPRTDALGDPLPSGALARMGTVRWRYVGAPRTIVPSPTGRTVAVSGFRGIGLFNRDDGRLVGEIGREHRGAFQFTPDGSRLVVRADRGVVRFYDAATGKPEGETKPVLEKDAEGTSHLLTADGGWIVTAGPTAAGHTLTLTEVLADPGAKREQFRLNVPSGFGTSTEIYSYTRAGGTLIGVGRENSKARKGPVVFRWEVATGKLVRTTPIDVSENGFRLSPDGEKMLTVQGGARVWDTRTGAEAVKLDGPLASGHHTRFSADGKCVVGAVYDPKDQGATTGVVWELERGKVLGRVRLPYQSNNLFLLSDGRTLLAADYGLMLTTWDLTTGRRVSTAEGHEDGLRHIEFSSDGATLYTASYGTAERITAWDAQSGKKLRELAAPGGSARFVLTPDNTVVTATYTGTLIGADATTGREVRRIEPEPLAKDLGGGIWGTELFPCRNPRTGRPAVFGVVSAEKGGNVLVALWDAKSGEVLARRPLEGGRSGGHFTISPDGRLFAREVVEPPAGVLLADATNCMAVVFEDVLTGNCVGRIDQPDCLQGSSLHFTPDGQSLVTWTTVYPKGRNEKAPAGTTTVRLWELRSGKQRLAFTLPVFGGLWVGEPEAVAVSPDGLLLAAARPDQTVSVWDLATGKEVVKRGGYTMRVRCLAFRPDGKALASGHEDGTAVVWDLVGLSRTRGALDRDAAWRDLALNADKAHRAILGLVADPKCVEFLRDRVKPTAPPPADELRKLIAELGSDDFGTRERAMEGLVKFGDAVDEPLRAAQKRELSPEQHQRITGLLKGRRLVESAPDRLRTLRCVEVLERVGTPEAAAVLRELTKGTPGARLTREASDALARLGDRRKRGQEAGETLRPR